MSMFNTDSLLFSKGIICPKDQKKISFTFYYQQTLLHKNRISQVHSLGPLNSRKVYRYNNLLKISPPPPVLSKQRYINDCPLTDSWKQLAAQVQVFHRIFTDTSFYQHSMLSYLSGLTERQRQQGQSPFLSKKVVTWFCHLHSQNSLSSIIIIILFYIYWTCNLLCTNMK